MPTRHGRSEAEGGSSRTRTVKSRENGCRAKKGAEGGNDEDDEKPRFLARVILGVGLATSMADARVHNRIALDICAGEPSGGAGRWTLSSADGQP